MQSRLRKHACTTARISWTEISRELVPLTLNLEVGLPRSVPGAAAWQPPGFPMAQTSDHDSKLTPC